MMFYIETDEGEVAEVADVQAWAEWFATFERRVALSELGYCEVSTVFLVTDYSLGEKPPKMYETLVVGGSLDGEKERYCTRTEALEGHERMVERVKRDVDEPIFERREVWTRG